MEDGFQRRRDPCFLLSTDPCLTAVGAPVALARNFAGYSSSLRARRQGRWGAWEKDGTAFNVAASFLKDRQDICVPVELLTSLVQEDSKLRKAARCPDLPDTACSDLSWPGACLENISAGGTGASYPPMDAPLLVHTGGSDNGSLSLLHPRSFGPGSTRDSGGNNSSGEEGCARRAAAAAVASANSTARRGAVSTPDAAVEKRGLLALYSGPIRQISAVVARTDTPPKLFARCDYSATLVKACRLVDPLHDRSAPSSSTACSSAPPPAGGRAHARRIKRARVAAGVTTPYAAALEGADAIAGEEREEEQEEEEEKEEEEGEKPEFDGFAEVEKLVFARRLTSAVCSPFTPAHAAFLDEEFRLFQWRADRGALLHGAGPLRFPASVSDATPLPDRAEVRRLVNADVALDYGSHPRVLWLAGKHRACRIDLREKPSPATLAPALDPGLYFRTPRGEYSVVNGGGGNIGGKGEAPKIRSLVVGRRSVHEVFVAAGLHLACMDARFPREVVARWDLPDEVDQLRWLPGLPGGGVGSEEIVLASGRRSPGFYVNTWASDVPGWRGYQAQLGLDETSPAASAAKRPLTFSLPVTPLSREETRSGGLFVGLPPPRSRGNGSGVGGGLCFVHATSAGDVYGQRLRVCRVGEGAGSRRENGKAVSATLRSALFSDRIQSMLPCGDACLDPDAIPDTPKSNRTDGGAVRTTGPAKGNNERGNIRDPNNAEHGGESVTVGGVDGKGNGEGILRDGSRGCEDGRDCEGRSEVTLPREQEKGQGLDTRLVQEASSLGGDGSGGDGGDGHGRDGGQDDGRGAGANDQGSRERRVEYFPVNAAALRQSAEDFADISICSHRLLPPLVDLVAPGKVRGAGGASRGTAAKGTAAKGSEGAGTGSAAERREQDFSDLRDSKAEVAEFLLKPRTPEELLAFCRHSLGLKFPSDPASDRTDNRTDGTDSAEEKRPSFGNTLNLDPGASASGSANGSGGDSGSRSRGSGGGGSPFANGGNLGSRAKKAMDRPAVASDLARAVLAWGPPIREIHTAWKAAAVGQGYAVASRFSRPLPRVATLVLCSAPDVLKGKPTPLLGPGTFGEPFSTDVTTEDVRWLKDQWDAT